MEGGMNNTTNSTDGVTLAPSPAPAPAADKVYIAGLFDYAGFEWGPLVFNATIAMLQNRTNGWWNVILNGTEIVSTIRDANCTEKKAVDEYWSLREWGQPLHGVVGGRCSGASAAVARIAGLENVPQVSPSASSSRLSNADDYSSFFRLVAPDDSRGHVGALVTLLRSFDWDRVSVISTDTPYTKDLATQFGTAWVGYHDATGATDAERAWTGETLYSHTIGLRDGEGSIEDLSIHQALDGVPTDEPAQNSRVILLLAHQEDANRILKLAYETSFQPDTIWIAPDGWAGRDDVNEISSSLPEHPGFLGVTPFVDQNTSAYKEYIELFKEYQKGVGIPDSDIIKELPTFAAEMVDSILSLALALDHVTAESRNDGNHKETVQALHNLDVDRGVSGRIRFTAEGHRENPQYRVSNFVSPDIGWRTVGSVGTTVGSANIELNEICWAQEGCALKEPPSDKYPLPDINDNVETWVPVVISIIVVLMLGLGLKYWLTKRKITKLKTRIEAMNNIDNELAGLNQQVENAKNRQASLIRKREELQDYPDTWSEAEETLVEVTPKDEEYWFVQNKLHESMDDGWISKVWRVQNKPLWTYYSFHKNRLTMIDVDDNERSVWHGTSSLDPSIIYKDRQDGFMMQFSSEGLWGRGVYFAHKSAYSYNYSYIPGQNRTERPPSVDGEREMFLAKLLIGNEVKLAQDRSITVPPINNQNGLKYNTVSGETAGSQVWIVYENGRAYPDYLVRYYKGERDPKRTPFATQNEAIMGSKEPGQDNGTPSPPESGVEEKVLWEYQDVLSWEPIGSAAQDTIEAAYQSYVGSAKQPTYSEYKSGDWIYRLDYQTMTQTNTEHFSHTQREVRRRELDV